MRTSEKLKQLRINAGMTQEQLAEKLFVSRELVSKWELGQRRPDIRTLRDAAGLFSAELEELLDDDGDIIGELSLCVPRDADVSGERMRELLVPFLDSLSERDNAVFVRRYFFLENASQIAAVFDVKDNQIRSILARTRKKLKKYLREVLK